MDTAIQLENDKDQWLELVKQGNSSALEKLYRTYRKDFVKWLCYKTSCNRELALDIFQESVLALYKNAKSGRLTEFQNTIKVYLFSIGKKIYLDQNRRKKIKTNSLETNEALLEDLLVVPQHENDLNERQQLVSKLLKKMRPACKKMLHLFYYRGFDMKEIAAEFNYKSANVTKVMKGRCMETLRVLVYRQMKRKV